MQGVPYGGCSYVLRKGFRRTQGEAQKLFLGFSEVFSDEYLESAVISESIADEVFNYNAAVFHAALISFDGRGVAFAAPSGTGKSTHIRLWRRLFGSRVECINGDKPLLLFRDGRFLVPELHGAEKKTGAATKLYRLKRFALSNAQIQIA